MHIVSNYWEKGILKMEHLYSMGYKKYRNHIKPYLLIIICFRHKVVLIQSMFRDFKLTQLIHQNSLQLALKRTAEIMAEGFKKQSAAFKKSNSKLAKDLEMIQNSVVKQVSTQVYEFLRSLNRVDRLKWKLTQN